MQRELSRNRTVRLVNFTDLVQNTRVFRFELVSRVNVVLCGEVVSLVCRVSDAKPRMRYALHCWDRRFEYFKLEIWQSLSRFGNLRKNTRDARNRKTYSPLARYFARSTENRFKTSFMIICRRKYLRQFLVHEKRVMSTSSSETNGSKSINWPSGWLETSSRCGALAFKADQLGRGGRFF